jgi:hypothetical protein
MTHGDKLDDIIQAAVARGDAPGVVAAVCEDVLRAAASAS